MIPCVHSEHKIQRSRAERLAGGRIPKAASERLQFHSTHSEYSCVKAATRDVFLSNVHVRLAWVSGKAQRHLERSLRQSLAS